MFGQGTACSLRNQEFLYVYWVNWSQTGRPYKFIRPILSTWNKSGTHRPLATISTCTEHTEAPLQNNKDGCRKPFETTAALKSLSLVFLLYCMPFSMSFAGASPDVTLLTSFLWMDLYPSSGAHKQLFLVSTGTVPSYQSRVQQNQTNSLYQRGK